MGPHPSGSLSTTTARSPSSWWWRSSTRPTSTVSERPTTPTARAAWRRSWFDVILMDVNLGDQDGLDRRAGGRASRAAGRGADRARRRRRHAVGRQRLVPARCSRRTARCRTSSTACAAPRPGGFVVHPTLLRTLVTEERVPAAGRSRCSRRGAPGPAAAGRGARHPLDRPRAQDLRQHLPRLREERADEARRPLAARGGRDRGTTWTRRCRPASLTAVDVPAAERRPRTPRTRVRWSARPSSGSRSGASSCSSC